MKPAKCFIVHKFLGWFYHTDGKLLTSGDEAVGRVTTDFIRIGTFEIISRHSYLFLCSCLGKVSRHCIFKKLCMTKKIVILVAPLIYFELHCRRLIKNCQAKTIFSKNNLRIWHVGVNLHRILFNLFVLIVNLNLYCSSEAPEVRANHLYCMCLTSVN